MQSDNVDVRQLDLVDLNALHSPIKVLQSISIKNSQKKKRIKSFEYYDQILAHPSSIIVWI